MQHLYCYNQDKFFKDRHYLAKEFPHIFPEGLSVAASKSALASAKVGGVGGVGGAS
jgi:hypothetical protein